MSTDLLAALEESVMSGGTAPTLHTMPRRTLADKGIAGPSGAHVIEEIHTPFNLAYITVTTGTTAFQNIVGVTTEERPDRITAAQKALTLAEVRAGDHLLFTYPPLVNVFPKEALEQHGVTWSFLHASSRDALLLALCKERPQVVLGESSFLRLALAGAKQLGLTSLLPQDTIFIAAGTPLDPDLAATVRDTTGGTAHDLYGCQEFGWLTLDGIPLRDDITLLQTDESEYHDLLVGGLPTGDRFPVLDTGHYLNSTGKIITYARQRGGVELETTILASPAKGRETVERLAKTILRIKAKIVRVSPDLVLDSTHTVLSVSGLRTLEGPVQTRMIDSLLRSQMAYQSSSKADPTWMKGR
ncbi:MAG: acyl carrier protein [Oscillospiraceae bacterium]|nr:acyl carrier protein [Oscillospiraceae bacterium]